MFSSYTLASVIKLPSAAMSGLLTSLDLPVCVTSSEVFT
jgi:hypothetical protein